MLKQESWAPGCRIEALHFRAEVLRKVRAFFAERQVLEVETPLLCQATVTDPHLDSIGAHVHITGRKEYRYLQTSPEYAMKRLLAAGSGSIYQICKAFRDGEQGRRHNCEFTMLEWYRPGVDLFGLMSEISDLLRMLGLSLQTEYLTYEQAFIRYAKVNPFDDTLTVLQERAHAVSGIDREVLDRRDCLDIILTHLVEPELGVSAPVFLWGYPVDQAALAKTGRADDREVALRFELYINGIELANGYDELVDGVEQRRRFVEDNRQRCLLGKREMPVDDRLLRALEFGMPACSGVALGFDRLLMILQNLEQIDQVMAFTQDRI